MPPGQEWGSKVKTGAAGVEEDERGKGERTDDAEAAEFGPELGGGVVQLEDVFGAAVESGAVAGVNEWGGAGAPAEERAIGAHAGGGGEHGGALDVAEVRLGGGISWGKHGTRARVGENEGEADEHQEGGEGGLFFWWE